MFKYDPEERRSVNAIHCAVGEATETWEYLEAQLSLHFVLFTKSDRMIGRRAYGAIASFRGRCDVIIAAAELHYHQKRNPKAYKRYRAFLNRVIALGSGRNEIIHAVIGDKDDTRGRLLTSEWILAPAPYLTRKHDKAGRPKYQLSVSDIRTFIERVENAIRDAGAISSRLTHPRSRKPSS
jgi:hypothetical protein